jgi:small-conductance mechanosensitive channel
MEARLIQFIPADFAARMMGWGTKLLISLLIFFGFAITSLIVKKIICRARAHADPQKEEVLTLLGSIARIALLVFGFVTALGTLGINVSALVAGLGLTGFALGFAFRDALSNVLAGVMILLYHPFYRGDRVAIIGLEGQVTGINLRYTTLQDEGRIFLIPNSILLTNAISLNVKPK